MVTKGVLAKGFYYYACLRDYDTAVPYFDQARQLLPNSSLVLQSLAFLERRRGQWDRSESYFNEAERLDPRNADLLGGHALNYFLLRRFPEALRKFDQVLNITPDNVETVALKALVAQAEGDLRRAGALLAPLHPDADHGRSEEHTSELQSHSDLVCRLLLEKKKENNVVLEVGAGVGTLTVALAKR